MLESQIEQVEAGLTRVQARLPDMPASEILLGRMIIFLGRAITAAYDRVLRPRGLTEADFLMLAALFSRKDGTAHPSDLCAAMGQSPANITRIGDALVKRGLITRVLSETDRRRMVLRITDAGSALLHELMPSISSIARTAFACLAHEEMPEVIAQLKRVAGNLDAACSDQQAGAAS